MSEDEAGKPLRRDLRREDAATSAGEDAVDPALPEEGAVPQITVTPPLSADDAEHVTARPLEPGTALLDGDLGADIVHPAASARIPGDTRRPLTRFPTDPIEVQPTFESGPMLGETSPLAEIAPLQPVRGLLAPWALALSILALSAAFFVGWGIPIALLAVGMAIVALRRPIEKRALAAWALALGLLATVYSLGWLIWAAMALERLG